MMLTIPTFIPRTDERVEHLMFKFGNCMRRAYAMKRKGADRLEVIKRLREKTGLHTRYVWTAYELMKNLPPHVTFGGLELQRLRERGEISREEYHRRRNAIIACLGQAWFKGNQCLRVVGNELRVSIAPREWAYLPLQIPERYEKHRTHLDGSKPYTVLIKRRPDGRGYDVRITVDVEVEVPERRRLMALDINSGHVDFAVVEKSNLRPIAFGRINCHELLNGRSGRNKLVVHKVVDKVRSIARHYGAEVVAGRMRTLTPASRRRANRKVHRMSQFKLRQVMRYKLPLSGVKYYERSEARTSKVGRAISKPMGLDVHKASAYAFAVKVADYSRFAFLRGVPPNEGDGSPRRGLSGGSGITSPRQALGLARDEGFGPEATPLCMGRGGGFKPFEATILHVKV